MAFPAKYPQLNEVALTPEARDVLIRVIRVAFPHPSFPDGPYERTADTIMAEAEQSTWFRVALTQGLLTLSHYAGGDFRELDDESATRVLRRIEATEFFGFIRRTTVLNLYDNQDVWDALGYEGPSFDKGGYINRGFNDLDWLPEPRIETYDGPETLVEIAAGVPAAVRAARGGTDAGAPAAGSLPSAASGSPSSGSPSSGSRSGSTQPAPDSVDTSNQPGRSTADLAEVRK